VAVADEDLDRREITANQSAMESESRAPATFSAGSLRARRIIQADMPATAKAVVRKQPRTMWA